MYFIIGVLTEPFSLDEEIVKDKAKITVITQNINKIYNNSSNIVDNMFSINQDKVNSEKKKNKKKDENIDENNNFIHLENVRKIA